MFESKPDRRYLLKMAGVGAVGVAVSSFAISSTVDAASVAPGVHGDFDVMAFGAKGDGKTLDTAAINSTIEAAFAAGGGTVRFPAGTYLSYSIHLKSHVDLYLGPGATILAAEEPASGAAGGYDPPEPNEFDKYQDFGHSHWRNSLIWGEGIHDVSIIGPGLIWGKGLKRDYDDAVLAAGIGNKTIGLKQCHNIILRDFSILHGGHFAILATGVDNLTVDNLKIDTNRDGMDIDCCRNVRISNCSVNSPWDDAICLKSSYAMGFAQSTDHVTISNCYVTGGYEEGTLLAASYKKIAAGPEFPAMGRIKFGTESNGGFRNITITNCVIEKSHGFALETVDGAILEDVSIINITMRDIVDVPIFLRLGRRMRGPEGVSIGKLQRVNFSNIVVSNCASRQASILTGLPGHYIEDIRLSNIFVLHQGGGAASDAEIRPPELEDKYPEADQFGSTPAHGFYIRHVKGIEMRDIEVRGIKDDDRPCFFLEDVENADFIHIKVRHAANALAFAFRDVKNVNTYQSSPTPDTHLESVQRGLL